MRKLIPLFTLIVALQPLLVAQETTVDGRRRGPTYSVIDASKVLLTYYKPTNLNASQLRNSLSMMHARSFLVKEGDAKRGPVNNLFTTGELLCIYETKAAAAQILEAAKILDKANAEQEEKRAAVAFMTYRPRYMSAPSLVNAISPLAGRMGFDRVTFVEASGAVILSGRGLNKPMVQQMLDEVDVPKPQVLLSCHVIQATKDGGSPGLPDALVSNLRRLLPGSDFRRLGTGVMRASTGKAGSVELSMTLDHTASENLASSSCVLEVKIEAYDDKKGLLTLSYCGFRITQRRKDGAKEPPQSFSTATTFQQGRYTVLGGMGKDPIYVVVQLQPAS